MGRFLAAGIAALAIATPAFAQDGAAEFDGVYIGGSVGYAVQNNDVGETILFDRGSNGSFGETITTGTGANAFSPGFCNGAATSNLNTACSNDKDGIDYHLRLGGDRQYGRFVVGFVVEGGKSDVRDSVSAFSTTPAFYTMTREIEWNAAVRARAGYTLGPRTLAYATFGGAYARLDHSFTTGNTANAFAVTGSDYAWGWQAGGGIQQKLGRNVSIGVEYLYSRYNDDDARIRVTQGTAGATNPFVLAGGADFRRNTNRFDFHAIRATAAFRF
jgi:outer membrane immunogenic protein